MCVYDAAKTKRAQRWCSHPESLWLGKVLFSLDAMYVITNVLLDRYTRRYRFLAHTHLWVFECDDSEIFFPFSRSRGDRDVSYNVKCRARSVCVPASHEIIHHGREKRRFDVAPLVMALIHSFMLILYTSLELDLLRSSAVLEYERCTRRLFFDYVHLWRKVNISPMWCPHCFVEWDSKLSSMREKETKKDRKSNSHLGRVLYE